MKYFSINYLWKTFLLSLPILGKGDRMYDQNMNEYNIIKNRINDNHFGLTIHNINWVQNKTVICIHEVGRVIVGLPEWKEGFVEFISLKIHSMPIINIINGKRKINSTIYFGGEVLIKKLVNLIFQD